MGGVPYSLRDSVYLGLTGNGGGGGVELVGVYGFSQQLSIIVKVHINMMLCE